MDPDRRWTHPGVALVVLALVLAGPAAAEEAHEHGFHRHHVGLFLGAASRPTHEGEREHGFAAGLEYEYRLRRWLGVGGLAEVATGDLRDAVFVGLVHLHPWRGLQLSAGGGVEINREESEGVGRFGVAYQLPLGERWTLAPNLNVDVVEGEPTWVYGLVLGLGF